MRQDEWVCSFSTSGSAASLPVGLQHHYQWVCSISTNGGAEATPLLTANHQRCVCSLRPPLKSPGLRCKWQLMPNDSQHRSLRRCCHTASFEAPPAVLLRPLGCGELLGSPASWESMSPVAGPALGLVWWEMLLDSSTFLRTSLQYHNHLKHLQPPSVLVIAPESPDSNNKGITATMSDKV
ncbi:unnamed protein product [Gadus morhua 'NCC']